MPAANAMLTLLLQLLPERARLGDEVFAAVTLRNTDKSDILVNGRMELNEPGAPDAYRDIAFIVEGPPGYVNTLRFHLRIGPPESDDFTCLAPGEALTRRYQLTRFYPMSQPGAYLVRAEYTNVHLGPSEKDPVWTGHLDSNPVTFQRII